MTSDALVSWRTTRAEHLEELIAAHHAVGGTGPGRRWRTEQINLALTLRLAVEFQGFSRDLHDLASQTFGRWVAPHDDRLARIVSSALTDARQLDRGNATEGNLSSDFSRFGLSFFPVIERRDARSSQRLVELTRLNRARNAIAHDNPGVITELRRAGRPVKLTTVRRWQGALNGLATTMDAVMAEHLATLFKRSSPW